MRPKYNIEDMYRIAGQHGIKCLSKEYIDNKTPLKWQCNVCGNVWDAVPSSIIRGSGCQKCGHVEGGKSNRLGVKGRGKTYSIDTLKEIAHAWGGELISTSFLDGRTVLNLRCKKGHSWSAVPGDIARRGYWCPQCKYTGVSESFCKNYFERLFNKEFKKSRPKWLRNPKTNYPMELDGYCKELGIAFEYQGEQHFRALNYDKTNQFQNRVKRDELKKELCRKNNITLLIIPYWIKYEEMGAYSIKSCKESHVQTPEPPIDFLIIVHLM